MRVISLAGSPRQPSRSSSLLALSHQWLASRGVEVFTYNLQDFSADDLLFANFSSPQLKQLIAELASADGLIVATPVYKASFSGALKTLLDLLPERALDHKVVLPLATAGSIGHMLAVDYALKPVLASLKAQEVLQCVFADDSLITDYHTFPATLDPALAGRLNESLENFYLALSRRRPIANSAASLSAQVLRV
jgi:FMN reductase